MKKVVYVITLLFCMSFANSFTLGAAKDCHAEACQEVAEWEAFAPAEMEDPNFVEQVYNLAYNQCVNG